MRYTGRTSTIFPPHLFRFVALLCGGWLNLIIKLATVSIIHVQKIVNIKITIKVMTRKLLAFFVDTVYYQLSYRSYQSYGNRNRKLLVSNTRYVFGIFSSRNVKITGRPA